MTMATDLTVIAEEERIDTIAVVVVVEEGLLLVLAHQGVLTVVTIILTRIAIMSDTEAVADTDTVVAIIALIMAAIGRIIEKEEM